MSRKKLAHDRDQEHDVLGMRVSERVEQPVGKQRQPQHPRKHADEVAEHEIADNEFPGRRPSG